MAELAVRGGGSEAGPLTTTPSRKATVAVSSSEISVKRRFMAVLLMRVPCPNGTVSGPFSADSLPAFACLFSAAPVPGLPAGSVVRGTEEVNWRNFRFNPVKSCPTIPIRAEPGKRPV
jgi:hypothetical protein